MVTEAWERGYWNRLHDFNGCHSGVEDPGNEPNIAGSMNTEMPQELQIIRTHKLRDLQIKNVLYTGFVLVPIPQTPSHTIELNSLYRIGFTAIALFLWLNVAMFTGHIQLIL